MKPLSQVERALHLSDAGMNNCEIGREIGINRRTVSNWVRGRSRIRKPTEEYKGRRREAGGACPRCSGGREFLPGLTRYSFAYLLGLYLGDGLISQHPRDVHRLRIFLDRKYP